MHRKPTKMSSFSSDMCQTCLSTDRRLVPLQDIHKLLMDLSLSELMVSNGSVCYVCNQILIRFSAFKSQALYAQELLHCKANTTLLSLSSLGYQKNDCYNFEFMETDPLILVTEIKYEDGQMSFLDSGNNANEVDIGSRNNLEVESRSTKTCVKENEIKVILNGKAQGKKYRKDAKSSINREVSSPVSRKKETKKLKTGRRTKEQRTVTTRKPTCKRRERLAPAEPPSCAAETDVDPSVDDKYETVEFTEEEMQKNREVKRNHPNFKKIPYKCDLCVLGFTKEETLQKHWRKHEKVGAHACAVCSLRFPSPKALARHRARHYTQFRCRLCAHRAADQPAMRAHCRHKHRRDTPHQIHCAHCSAVCQSREEMSAHAQAEHPPRCAECGECFKGLNTLQAHIKRIHSVKREFSCEECSKTFTARSRLEAHAAGHGGAAARRLAYCAPCRRQYKDIFVYRNHRINSPAHAHQAYECGTCHKKFASRGYWKRHVDFFHLNKSKFNCLECNKMFMSAFSLRHHRQLRHGEGERRERTHPCDLCDKTFFSSSTLANHKLTHSAERSYMCSECGHTFKQRPSLYSHCRLVHRRHHPPDPGAE